MSFKKSKILCHLRKVNIVYFKKGRLLCHLRKVEDCVI